MTVAEWQVVRSVGIDDGPDAYVLGIAENVDGSGHCLLFQAPPTNPEWSSPWDDLDTYDVVDHNQALASGGIVRVDITADRLEVAVTAEAANELGLPEASVALQLAITDAERAQLVEDLHRILRFSTPEERAVLEIDGRRQDLSETFVPAQTPPLTESQTAGRNDPKEVRRRIREDPCTIVLAPGRVDVNRMIEAWLMTAEKLGWPVSLTNTLIDPRQLISEILEPQAIAHVDADGVTYCLMSGPRKRTTGITIDASGAPIERRILQPSVWAEPIVTPDLLG